MQLQLKEHCLLLAGHSFLEPEQISDWLNTPALQNMLRIVEFNAGADRAQWQIHYGDRTLILFFEALSESLWFETLHSNDAQTLKMLSDELKTVII
jgi:hypothetical protein